MNMNIQFDNPSVLLLLWLVPVIIWLWLKLRKRSEDKLRAFISGPMQTKLRFPISKGKLLAQIIAIAIGISLLIISAAGPFSGKQNKAIESNGHDIAILLDVSSSMTARDVQPDRLTHAKSQITQTASKLPKDRIALLAFRRSTTILCPLTYDREFLYQAVKLASATSASAGETDLGTAIMSAADIFTDNSTSRRIILIFSDGEDLSRNIAESISYAIKKRITIFAIGIGKAEGATIPDPLREDTPYQYKNQPVITKLNEQTLREVTTATGGHYISLNNEYARNIQCSDICREYLREITSTETAKTMKQLRIYHYNRFLLPAYISLLFAILLGMQRIKRTSTASTKLSLLLITIFITHASTGYSEPRSKRVIERSRNAPWLATFNIAASQFASTNYTAAIDTLNTITADSTETALHINMAYGCTYFKAAQQLNCSQEQVSLLKKATQSFNAILKQEPTNKTAEYNLAVAYRTMLTVSAKFKEIAPDTTEKDTNNSSTKNSNDKASQDEQQNKEDSQTKTDTQPSDDLSQEEIDNILSTILSREKEYQTKKQRYGKLIPLQADVRDW